MESPLFYLQSTCASTKGWGATCQGISTRRLWPQEARKVHINILELKAVHLAILTFTKSRIVQTIHVQMNDKIALSYLVKMGRTHKDLLGLSKQTCDYLQSKKIIITAEYLPGHLNVTADWESHNFQDKSDQKLPPKVFAKICPKLSTPSVDLLAYRMSHQLSVYMTWKIDPGSHGTNAMYQPWAEIFPYVFPPFSLIPQVLSKLRKEGIPMILLAITSMVFSSSEHVYSQFIFCHIGKTYFWTHQKKLILQQ